MSNHIDSDQQSSLGDQNFFNVLGIEVCMKIVEPFV